MANTTTPKDENLDPIKSCGIPQTVTQLKALLGATNQMCERLKKERERLDKLGIPSHPLFGSSLSFKELSRADNPQDRAHRRAHREETKIG